MKLIKTISIRDPDKQQTLVPIPMSVLHSFGDADQVEFVEHGFGLVRVDFVSAKTPARNRRYGITKNNGAAQISMPRSWLRDRSAKAGDGIELLHDPEKPSSLYLHYVRKAKVSE